MKQAIEKYAAFLNATFPSDSKAHLMESGLVPETQKEIEKQIEEVQRASKPGGPRH